MKSSAEVKGGVETLPKSELVVLVANAPVVVEVWVSRRVESPDIDDEANDDNGVADTVKDEIMEETAVREEVGEEKAEATEAEDRSDVSSAVPDCVLPGVDPELLVDTSG